jgi:hypothetical protein
LQQLSVAAFKLLRSFWLTQLLATQLLGGAALSALAAVLKCGFSR